MTDFAGKSINVNEPEWLILQSGSDNVVQIQAENERSFSWVQGPPKDRCQSYL